MCIGISKIEFNIENNGNKNILYRHFCFYLNILTIYYSTTKYKNKK